MIRKAGGRGKTKQALSLERAQRVAQMRNKDKDSRHAKAIRSTQDRILTDDDRQIIETVLLHILNDRADGRFSGDGRSANIALAGQTFEGPSFYTGSEIDPDLDESMNSELSDAQASDISLD